MTPIRRRLRLFALLLTLIAMWNTIRHLFEGVRPFDWMMFIIELLVLVAILWFEGREVWHERKLRKRVSSLEPIMLEGQTIQRAVPEQYPSGVDIKNLMVVEEWRDSVEAWSTRTSKLLACYSARAAAAFSLMVKTGVPAQIIYREGGHSFSIHGPLRESYQRLVMQLDNLRSIMEKPDAYF